MLNMILGVIIIAICAICATAFLYVCWNFGMVSAIDGVNHIDISHAFWLLMILWSIWLIRKFTK